VRGTSERFFNQTIELWQPLAKHKLTSEDARQISANLAGFFGLLSLWSANQYGDVHASRSAGRLTKGLRDGGPSTAATKVRWRAQAAGSPLVRSQNEPKNTDEET
jgi:hypothetical protein